MNKEDSSIFKKLLNKKPKHFRYGSYFMIITHYNDLVKNIYRSPGDLLKTMKAVVVTVRFNDTLEQVPAQVAQMPELFHRKI